MRDPSKGLMWSLECLEEQLSISGRSRTSAFNHQLLATRNPAKKILSRPGRRNEGLWIRLLAWVIFLEAEQRTRTWTGWESQKLGFLVKRHIVLALLRDKEHIVQTMCCEVPWRSPLPSQRESNIELPPFLPKGGLQFLQSVLKMESNK